MRSVVTPRHEPHRVLESEPLDERGDRALVLGLADAHELGVVAFGAHLGECLEQRCEALHGHVGARGGHEPTRDARDLGHRREDLGVDADGHDVQAVERDAHLREMSRLLEFSDTVTYAGIARATFICMSRNPYHRRSVKRRYAFLACARSRSRSTVIGWCSVSTIGQPSLHHPEQAGAEALVVVHDVEVGAAVLQQPPGAEGERVRLGEAGRAHDPELLDVDAGLELVRPRHPKRVVAACRGRGSAPWSSCDGSSSSG